MNLVKYILKYRIKYICQYILYLESAYCLGSAGSDIGENCSGGGWNEFLIH